MVTHYPLLASCKPGIVLLFLKMTVPVPVGREMWKALLPSLHARVLDQMLFGWWYKAAFLKSIGLVWDLYSRDDPRISSWCLLDCSQQSEVWAPQMRKTGSECSLAIWQSPSGAKQSLGRKILQRESCRVGF